MSMKAKILEVLRERETYISGQELCEQFGVSRTAVWKAIGQLKKEGYVIEAVQNKGDIRYCSLTVLILPTSARSRKRNRARRTDC